MGWDFSHREPGMTTRAWFEREFSHGTPEARTEFLGTAMVGTTFYAAVRTIKTGQVWALVCLTQRQRGYFNFGYKSMDETMGPAEAQMPPKLLDLLTDTDHASALEWRAACRSNAHKRTVAAALKRGDVIRLSTPVQFSGIRPWTDFRLLDGKAGRFAALADGKFAFNCRLGRDWATRYDWALTEVAPA